MLYDAVLYEAEICFVAQQDFHRGRGFTFASDYQIKEAKIGVYVECEAVRGDPARDVNADGCDLTALSMDPRQALDAECIDTKVGHGPYQHFFKIAHVAMDVFTIGTKIDNRVTDELAQAVISHFPATIGFKQRHVTRSELLFVEQD